MSHQSADTLHDEAWEAHWHSENVVSRWLATLFSAELSREALGCYSKGEAGPILQLLREEYALETEVKRIENALAALTVFSSAHLELAADFAELFLVDARTSVPPYASFWNDGERLFQGETAQRMAERLTRSGFSVTQDFNEPADHLAVMLEYLGYLCERLATLPQGSRKDELEYIRSYLRTELCSWLPAFAARCNEAHPASDLYPAVASLTAAWCQQLAEAIGPEDLSGRSKVTEHHLS